MLPAVPARACPSSSPRSRFSSNASSNSIPSSRWYHYCTKVPRIEHISETPPYGDFDVMARAAEGAGIVQNWLTSAAEGSAAWTASESFLVIPGPWQKDVCFWYDTL
eukprot:1919325-Pyramimonas_sp.AAC.1